MWNLFKRRKKSTLEMVSNGNAFEMRCENGLYKVYKNGEVVTWGTNLLSIMEYIKEHSEV